MIREKVFPTIDNNYHTQDQPFDQSHLDWLTLPLSNTIYNKAKTDGKLYSSSTKDRSRHKNSFDTISVRDMAISLETLATMTELDGNKVDDDHEDHDLVNRRVEDAQIEHEEDTINLDRISTPLVKIVMADTKVPST